MLILGSLSNVGLGVARCGLFWGRLQKKSEIRALGVNEPNLLSGIFFIV